MKCNYKNKKTTNETMITCCICGKKITPTESNNPYPVRDYSNHGDSVNRCCHTCNREVVIPSRTVLTGAPSEAERDKCIETMHQCRSKHWFPHSMQ
jgi:hypothetical protein